MASLDTLAESELISRGLSTKLKEAKGMRNIISHQYGSVDDEIVFESITSELSKDVLEGIKYVKKMLRNS